MGRKCSHCGNNGHNSRTCSNIGGLVLGGGGLKLFGVHLRLDSQSMKKTLSCDFLQSSSSSSSSSTSFSPSSSSSSLVSIEEASEKNLQLPIGYHSDDLLGKGQERKKGVPWTEEEHRTFLVGLEKLGKGDWRGISRSFVPTRTPTQVASHAQKYFLRQNGLHKKKRRSSLFDVVKSSETTDQITISSSEFPSLDRTETPSFLAHSNPNAKSKTEDPDFCLHLMPSSSASMCSSSPSLASRAPSIMAEAHVHLPLHDLELTISSLGHKNSELHF